MGNLPWLFFFAALAIPAFYAVGLLVRNDSTFTTTDFWRFWVVHLWVEDFLELFTTVMVAYIFVLLGVVNQRVAMRLIYLDVILYSAGGVIGTMHHLYFSGEPALHMALGAFFSAAEVIPLTFLTVEAWSFLQLGAQQSARTRTPFPHFWSVMFLASVGFWNFLGAGVFGFLINLPIVSYYEIGTALTANHAHAAMMGVYGMLAVGLALFCLRYLIPEKLWSDRAAKISFWSLNLGLGVDGVCHAVSARLHPALSLAERELFRRPLAEIHFRPHALAARMDAAARRRGVHFGRHAAGALPLLARRAASETTTAARKPGRHFVHGNPGKPKIRRRMIHGIHIEVLLAGGYALLLVGVSVILELVARHAHHRSEHFRNSGFTYKKQLDVWQCPTGIHLTREQTDFQRKIATYRAPAHKCNGCLVKGDCTDSHHGRVLESRLDAWLQSELNRFHRGISLALLLLAVLILAAEMFEYQAAREWLVLGVLLLPIGLAGSRYWISFSERSQKNG